jgi:acetyl esterase/lipase
MREWPRRQRWAAAGVVTVGAVIVAFSLVVVVPPVLAGAIVGSSPPHPPSAVRGVEHHGAGGGSPSGPASPSPSDLLQHKTTLTYCDDGATVETLDAYEPTPVPSGVVPAVVYVHGGGWTGGDSALTPGSLVGRVATAIEAKGWVFVSINYRLAPRFRWPAQIDDAACAVRFLRAHALSLHVDAQHIGAIGDSAGGQIVSLLGLAGPRAAFDAGPDGDRSSAVQAVVDLYGPADLTAADWLRSPVVQSVAPDVFGTLLGPASAGASASPSLVAASPVTYVGPGAPPFLIMQGAEDTVVPPDQSRELADRLRADGNSVTLVMVRHAQHEFRPVAGGVVTPAVTALAAQASAFLIRHLATR